MRRGGNGRRGRTCCFSYCKYNAFLHNLQEKVSLFGQKYHRNITEISLRTMQVMRAVGGFVIFVILLFEDCIVTRNGNICDYADGWGHRASGCPNRHATLLAANGYANMGPPYI